MGKVVGKVPRSRDDHRPVLHGKADGTPLGLPDGALDRVILAVEIPGIGEIAVVGYLDVVRPRPHERAHYGFREEKAGRIASLDARDPDVRCYAHDADAVLGSGDCTGGVRPM